MPQPTRSDVHVNRPLTNISVAYIQNAKDFIADKVFPIVPVMKVSDKYFTYEKKYWMQTQAAPRADGTESAGQGYTVDSSPFYSAEVFAVHKDIGDQTRANADDPINMDRDATLFVTQQLLLRREKDFANKYIAANTWTGDADFTPTIRWDLSGSDPIQDVDNEKSQVKSKTGFLPNTLVVTPDVFFVLRNHPLVLDRIKYTQRAIVTEDLLAALFGVEKFLVMWAVLDTAPEQVPNVDNVNYLVDNACLLVYANPAPSILQPSGGYIFSWQGLFGAGAYGNRIKTFRMEHLESDRVEGEMAYDQKIVGADLGVYFKTPLAV